jgi:hypothetical protein
MWIFTSSCALLFLDIDNAFTSVSVKVASVRALHSTNGIALTSVFIESETTFAFKPTSVKSVLTLAKVTVVSVTVVTISNCTELFAHASLFDKSLVFTTSQLASRVTRTCSLIKSIVFITLKETV